MPDQQQPDEAQGLAQSQAENLAILEYVLELLKLAAATAPSPVALGRCRKIQRHLRLVRSEIKRGLHRRPPHLLARRVCDPRRPVAVCPEDNGTRGPPEDEDEAEPEAGPHTDRGGAMKALNLEPAEGWPLARFHRQTRRLSGPERLAEFGRMPHSWQEACWAALRRAIEARR